VGEPATSRQVLLAGPGSAVITGEPWWRSAFDQAVCAIDTKDLRLELESGGWRLLTLEVERSALFSGLTGRYPSRGAYPLLRRDDGDDVLALTRPWRLDAQPVLEIHDFAEPGWELNGEWETLDAWWRERSER
jgi:hypothetical protein